MVNAPVQIVLRSPKKHDQETLLRAQIGREDADKIENHINSRMIDAHIVEFDFFDIATALHMTRDRVRELLNKVEYNSNGITVCNPRNAPKISQS